LAENNRADDINLDDIEVEILIIGKNAGPLNQAAAFLIRRGWPTRVHTNLSQAVEDISNNKPDFILLSVNHPSPSIIKFPQAVGAAFNIDCIAFAESGDTASQSKVAKMKTAHKIQGMPSGPNLQRVIRKALAEKFEAQEATDAAEKSEAHIADMAGDNGIHISGSGSKAGNGPVVIQKADKSATADAGVIISQGEKSETHGNKRKDSKRLSLKSLKEKGAVGKVKIARSSANAGDDELVSDETAVSEESSFMSDMRAIAAGDGSDSGTTEFPVATVTDLKALIEADGEEAQGPKQSMILQPTVGTNRHPKGPAYRPNHESDDGEGPVTASGPEAPVYESGPARAENRYHPPAPRVETEHERKIREEGAEYFTRERKDKEAAAEAGPERANVTPITAAAQIVPVGIVERIGVFPVNSKATAGFVIVAVDGIGDASDAFLASCESEVEAQFRATGVYGELEKGFWLSIPEVNFEAWSAEKGLFNFCFVHQDIKVNAAFFPCTKNFVGLKESTRSEMVTVDVADLSTDVPVNFKAYIYLEKNKKYLLYLREGRKLAKEQKAKLLKHGGKPAFCVRNKDLQNFKKFQTSNFLYEMIKSLMNAA
jgi:hypothetical protein